MKYPKGSNRMITLNHKTLEHTRVNIKTNGYNQGMLSKTLTKIFIEQMLPEEMKDNALEYFNSIIKPPITL